MVTLLLLLACAPAPDSQTCKADEEQCADDGSAVQHCSEDGDWADYETCASGCEVDGGVPGCIQASSDEG